MQKFVRGGWIAIWNKHWLAMTVGRRKSFAGRWCGITFEELRVYALAARKQSCVEGILRAGSCDNQIAFACVCDYLIQCCEINGRTLKQKRVEDKIPGMRLNAG